jgi:hypothetical protein
MLTNSGSRNCNVMQWEEEGNKKQAKLSLLPVSSSTKNITSPAPGLCARDGRTVAPHMTLCGSQCPGRLGP